MKNLITEIGLFMAGITLILLFDNEIIVSVGLLLILVGGLRFSQKKRRESGKIKMKETARKTENDLKEGGQYTVKHFSTAANRKRKRSYMVILKPENSDREYPYMLPELPPEKFTYEEGEFKKIKEEGLFP